jgi:SAM-dependent methyltransferase
MANIEYTKLWVDGFDEKRADKYNTKFYTKFEKNIKHRQQVSLVKKYLKQGMVWLDAPVGSGRMMSEVPHDRALCHIFDNSQTFLDYSQKKLGISPEHVYKGDLFAMNLPTKFDFISSFHTLAAFEDFSDILLNYIDCLQQDGILIVDIVNKDMMQFMQNEGNSVRPEKQPILGFTQAEIVPFFDAEGCEVIDIIPHDYFDNMRLVKWRKEGNFFSKRIKRFVWKLINQAYFKLNLYPLLSAMEDKENIAFFSKYIVVAKKL